MLRRSDIFTYSLQVLLRHKFRSIMVLLATSIGIASVLVLTAFGEGARRYVLNEFSFLGSDILVMFPGKKETTGGLPPMMGTAARDITLSDLQRLATRIAAIELVTPLVVGSAEVSYQQRAREVFIIGSNSTLVDIRQLTFTQGRNLETTDLLRASNECLVGETIRTELLANASALGQWLRIADYRCRIVGVLGGRGDAFGMDLSDTVIVSVQTSQHLFNTQALFRVLIKTKAGYDVIQAKTRIEQLMKELHQSEEDVTVIIPDSLMATFDQVLMAMTLTLAAVAAISLLVAGILIMNITLISVSQRTEEIGLLKALGARSIDVQHIILTEAILIVSGGIVCGLFVGFCVVSVAKLLFPDVPFSTPLWAYVSSLITALSCGLVFAWLPAKRASQLLPINALQKR